MFNYKSVRSSEPQIRSNPALRQVNEKSGFQKRLSTLLEPISLPFPTFQIFKDITKSILENHTHYAWIRPAHLRSTWIVLGDDLPLIMIDPRDERRKFSLRIPFDKRRIQHTGPIIMEGAWDAQDHVLWIWDVVIYEKENIWESKPYSQRWDILKNVLNNILDCGHPMSDAEVKVPDWQSLENIATNKELDTATSIEFQPEKPAKRRILYLVKGDDFKYNPTSHHERKMQASTTSINNKPFLQKNQNEYRKLNKVDKVENTLTENKIVLLNDTSSEKSESNSINEKITPKQEITDKQRVAKLTKDTLSKLPDTYRLKTVQDEDLGLAAVRSLHISKQIRELLKTKSSLMVDILWFEPFQKYEIKKIHT